MREHRDLGGEGTPDSVVSLFLLPHPFIIMWLFLLKLSVEILTQGLPCPLNLKFWHTNSQSDFFFAAILKIPLKNFGNESDIHIFILLSLESCGVFNISCDISVFVLNYHLQFLFKKKKKKRQQNTNYWGIYLSQSLLGMIPLKNIFNLLSLWSKGNSII